jgi:hypothetical protein
MMFKSIFVLAVATLGFAGAGSAAETAATAHVARDYTVFVDPPTGFTFVKLPKGWKFVGKVSETDLAKLPGTVVTALLKSSDSSVPMRGARATQLD